MAKSNEKFKTYKNVFDDFTERNIFKLHSQGHFEHLQSPISIGKESNVFSAVKGKGFVIVKIYRLETCDFNRMFDYIRADPRYRGLQRKRRKIIFSWTQREFRNLMKAREAGVKVPTPYTFKNNILLEEFIGSKTAAPMLKDQPPSDPEKFLSEVIKNMRLLAKAGLVHGDLSSFNILNDREHPVFIDFSQATTTDDSNYEDYLLRDVKNIAIFFSKIGLEVSKEELIKRVRA
ncbi:MAG: serine protein kinase RIO [Nanoarchaeota archaeon]|nr:serine protein kinase RIO [Nanoarchaeota archaeon]